MLIRPREGESHLHIDFVPMVDVLFNILIFFLLATSFKQLEREMQIALPYASSSGPLSATLRELVINVTDAGDLIEATSDTGAYVLLSGVLKRTSSKLTKICNDIRLLASGPRCGFNEINLPQMQPGSSIMPGKVNPVIPEVVNQVGFLVIGLDLTVTLAASAGQLQLNVMEPVITLALFTSISTMENAVNTLRVHCIDGITANAERSRA